jgi:hypothetical protein
MTVTSRPGEDWLEIIMQPTLETFGRAFVAKPELCASIFGSTITGIDGIRLFLAATRAMYDRVDFTAEHRFGPTTYLEWEGQYRGGPVTGVTILERDATGVIKRIRLFHLPFGQLVMFADDLTERLTAFASSEGYNRCA